MTLHIYINFYWLHRFSSTFKVCLAEPEKPGKCFRCLIKLGCDSLWCGEQPKMVRKVCRTKFVVSIFQLICDLVSALLCVKRRRAVGVTFTSSWDFHTSLLRAKPASSWKIQSWIVLRILQILFLVLLHFGRLKIIVRRSEKMRKFLQLFSSLFSCLQFYKSFGKLRR